MVPKTNGTAVNHPVSMLDKPSCFTINVTNTAIPTLTPAWAK